MVKVPAMLVAIALTLTTIPGYTETTIVHMVQHSVRNHLEPLIPSFEAQFPGVKVVLEGPFPATEYVDKLTARIAANLEPDVTDLFYSLAVPFRDAGMFEDLQPWFDRDLKISLKDFVPAAIQSSSHPRYGIWGMPWNMYVLHPIYNETMFAEAGLADPWSMGKAWTWDTLKEFGGKLTRIDSDGQVQTIGIGSSPTLGRQVQLVNQAGGHIWDQSVQPWESLLLSDPVRIGMTYYIDLFERGIAALVGPGFTSGKVGIELNGGNISIGNHVSANLPFNWGISLWPYGPANNSAHTGGSSWQIIKTSKNKDLAWEWLKHVLYTEQGAIAVMRAQGRASAVAKHNRLWPSLWQGQSPTFKRMIDIINNPANRSSDLADMPWWGQLNSMSTSELTAVIRHEKPLESALIALDDFMKSQINEYFKQYDKVMSIDGTNT